jgi:hypothetical protein
MNRDHTEGSQVRTPEPSIAVSSKTNPEEGFPCPCGCHKRLPTLERVRMHAIKECWICGRRFRHPGGFRRHEHEHLDSNTPSVPARRMAGFRCLGCGIKFRNSSRAPDWEGHKRLGRCSRHLLAVPSMELECVPTKRWEDINLGRSRNRKLAVRTAQSTIGDRADTTTVASEVRDSANLTWPTPKTEESECSRRSLLTTI